MANNLASIRPMKTRITKNTHKKRGVVSWLKQLPLNSAPTYSPAYRQYHRRGRVSLLCSGWLEVGHRRYRHLLMLFDSLEDSRYRHSAFCFTLFFLPVPIPRLPSRSITSRHQRDKITRRKAPSLTPGILVPVSFAVTGFTLPAYQRRLLRRPYKTDTSSRGRFRA